MRHCFLRRAFRFLLLYTVLAFAWNASSQRTHAQAVSPLAFDQPATGQITQDTFRQIYSLTGRSSDVITLILTATSGTLDPVLILTDDQGALIARTDGEGQPLSAAIQA